MVTKGIVRETEKHKNGIFIELKPNLIGLADYIENIEYGKRAILATHYLGGENIVVHPVMPYGWEKEADPEWTIGLNRDFFKTLCEYAMQFNINLCMENMPCKVHSLSRIPAIYEFVKELNLPNLYICIDTGHCAVCGDDPGEMVKLCGDKLKTLHVHDNDGKMDLHSLPYTGVINWASFRDALQEIKYDGVLSLETSIRYYVPAAIKEDLQKSLAKVANYLAGNID